MGFLYELKIVMGRERELEDGTLTRPNLLNSKNPGREDTLEQAAIIDQLPDLGYKEIFDDLAINKGKLRPRDAPRHRPAPQDPPGLA